MSNQDDMSAHGFGVKATNEERTSNKMPGVDTVIEKVSLMVTSSMENRLNGKNIVEAFKTLQLHKSIPGREKCYDAWMRYLEMTPLATLEAELKVSGRDGESSYLKVLKALIKANAPSDIQTKLQTALIEFWNDTNKCSREIIELLELNKSTDDTLYIKLLTMWVEYMKSKDRSMLLALAYSPDNTRLKILEGLFKIVGAEEDAKVLQDYELTFWEKKKVSAVSLFTKLKLNDVPRKFYFDMWVMYVVRTLNMPIKDMRSVITMLSRRYGDEGLLEMLDALEKTGFNYHMRVELKSALTTSWKNKKKSPHDVFKLLKLNMESEPNYSVDIQRLSMWFQYVDENLSRPGTQMEEVIRDCELDIRVMVLGGLKKIDGAEYVVKILENSLLELFNGRDGLFGDQVVQVFRDLKLDDGLEKLLRHPNLDLFKRFAAKFEPGKTKEASLITAARTVYKDIPLGKTLMAAQGYDVTVKPLLFKLFKQWKERHQRIVNQLEGDPHADTKAFVLAFGREW